MTHSELVRAGREWLSRYCPVVVTEICGGMEEPDVLGFETHYKIGYGTTLLECKVSRNDFRSDEKKFFRREPSFGMGDYRYFLVPEGLIDIHEVPEGWGLLELKGKRVVVRKKSELWNDVNKKNELHVLVSCLRRIGIQNRQYCSIRAYTIPTKNRATMSVNKIRKTSHVQFKCEKCGYSLKEYPTKFKCRGCHAEYKKEWPMEKDE